MIYVVGMSIDLKKNLPFEGASVDTGVDTGVAILACLQQHVLLARALKV